ncbi:zinc transporter ZIP4 [Platysternon megacephalum]|uniref:Zinc transporter ZIP4 n=1 Tax=Platysternon megacephalum TaxID=55544 RepID=A0A4D9DGM4_9SAUR|nr:zinc transporter ZIP4 [Platysternon megacephalum]
MGPAEKAPRYEAFVSDVLQRDLWPDTSRIFVALGYGFFAELTLTEALRFPAGAEGAREEGTLRRVEPALAESRLGEGSSGPPKSLRGGSVPRSSRNEYMRSGLYSTFTIQSLQASPPGRAPRQDPPALCSEPLDPPDLAPGKMEEIPQLEISIEGADESEPLQVRWPCRPSPELAASQRRASRPRAALPAAVPQLPRPSTGCISRSCPQVFVAPEPLDAERPPPEATPPRDPGLRPVVVKVEAQRDAEGSSLLVLIDSGVKQEAPPAEEAPRGTEAELPAGEGPQEEKGEEVPGGAPSEGHGPKGRKPKDLALPSLPGQEKISAASGSLLAPGGGAGSGLTPTVISTHALFPSNSGGQIHIPSLSVDGLSTPVVLSPGRQKPPSPAEVPFRPARCVPGDAGAEAVARETSSGAREDAAIVVADTVAKEDAAVAREDPVAREEAVALRDSPAAVEDPVAREAVVAVEKDAVAREAGAPEDAVAMAEGDAAVGVSVATRLRQIS